MSRISDFTDDWGHLAGRSVYLACSGGVDSMVLLHLLHQVGSDLSVLHVNYNLRGIESGRDEQLVRETCVKLEIPFEVRQLDTRKILQEKGGNLQDVARRYRYDWFREILQAHPGSLIALGHHLDDQVETFFQHIARKSGIMGMAGIPEVHGGVIRPLLRYPKEEILGLAKARGIAWREDLSNQQSDYTRNKLRNLILPRLEEAIPELRSSVMTLVEAFQQTQRELEIAVSAQVEQIRRTGSWPLADFDVRSSEEKAEILRSTGVRLPFIAEIEKIRLSQKGRKLVADGVTITRESDCFHFQFSAVAPLPELHLVEVQQLPSVFDPDTLYLDASGISGKLTLRRWQPGDRMQPKGMKGSKLISDLLKDAHVPAHEKAQALVLADDRNILWCVGLRVSEIALADEKSEVILKISVGY